MDEEREEPVLRTDLVSRLRSSVSWIQNTPMRIRVIVTGSVYFSVILVLSSTLIPGLEPGLVALGLLPSDEEVVNYTHIGGWVYPVYDLGSSERPGTPSQWLDRGYGFLNQTITCWVYNTDFVRIDHRIVIEILNQSMEAINLTLPYGSAQITHPDEIRVSAIKGSIAGRPRGEDLDIAIDQSENHTLITVNLAPEMGYKHSLFELQLMYRLLDTEGHKRWGESDTVKFCPGCFDEGTWKLIVEIVPYATDQVFPTGWEPEDGREIEYFHGTEGINGYETEIWRGVGWAYLADMPRNQTFTATFTQKT